MASRAKSPSNSRYLEANAARRAEAFSKASRDAAKSASLATPAVIRQVMLDLLERRSGKTICPSEVARAIDPVAYLSLMNAVRAVAVSLEKRGVVRITQRGKPVSLAGIRGPIRIGFA